MSATTTPDGPAAPGRLERRKQQTRQRLMTAAQELFVRRGYEATTYDEIAQRADVARQTAFNHFPRKEDFLRAWTEQRRANLRDLLSQSAFQQISAPDQLTAYLRVLAEFNRTDREVGSLLAKIFASGAGFALAETAPDAFAASIRHGIRHGDFAPDIDPDLVAEVVFDSYLCTLGRWLRQDPPFDLADALIRKLEVILDGIRPAR
ncbi:TetR/AcrR family transcriptional regulator [Nocardia panacis]|uniref:TetR/AcrR family transcriptional regulator n=1 Tax=Nocardia panacis TaxID=2340916 RepID=UPI0011C3FBA7|nr:TetR/AcrR family transcriptional regulator [Nocardia panacis]